VALLLVSWALLTWQLGERSLWFDEYLALQMSRGSAAQVVAAAAADVHPPLYFLGLGAWTAAAGSSDYALRWFSAAAGLLAVALMAALARQVLGRRAGLPAALLLALTPAFVEFSRMARYYALVVALALLCTLLLVRAARRGGGWAWLGYAAAGLALISTFYPAAVLFAAHGLWIVWLVEWDGELHPALVAAHSLWLRRGRARRPALVSPAPAGVRGGKGWLLAVGGVAVAGLALYGPVLLARATAISQAGGAALARSGLGLALGLGMTGYTFAVGETVFPWNPAAWLGLAAVGVILVGGAWRQARGIWPALAGAALCALGVAVITTFVSVNTPFLNVPGRALFAWPFVGLALVAGWQSLPRRAGQVAGGALLLAWAVGLGNYYTGRQFLNPIYLTPAREAAELIAANAGPNDLVIVETDSLVGYYLGRIAGAPTATDTAEVGGVGRALEKKPPQVWLVTLGRDQTAGLSTAEAIRAALAADYAPAATTRLLPLDKTYLHYKELLLRRKAYTNRLTIETFTRRTP